MTNPHPADAIAEVVASWAHALRNASNTLMLGTSLARDGLDAETAADLEARAGLVSFLLDLLVEASRAARRDGGNASSPSRHRQGEARTPPVSGTDRTVESIPLAAIVHGALRRVRWLGETPVLTDVPDVHVLVASGPAAERALAAALAGMERASWHLDGTRISLEASAHSHIHPDLAPFVDGIRVLGALIGTTEWECAREPANE